MIESLPGILKTILEAATAAEFWKKLSRDTTGDASVLIDEIKNNLRFCRLVLEDHETIDDSIDVLSTAEFDRLRRSGFKFKALSSRKIRKHKSLENTDLAYWQGKTTRELVVSIYDKIKDIQILYPRAKHSTKRRWNVRVINIQKRILLLLKHLDA